MAVTNYETVFIASPDIANEAVDQLMAKIKQAVTDNKGTFTNEDRWGRRRLAYPIQGQREGFYVVLTFSAEGTIVSALEHLFRVTDSVVRHLTIRIIKKNKTFPPRRVKPAGATADAGRPGSRGGYSRPLPVVTPPPGLTPAAAAAPAPAPAAAAPAPAAEAAPATPSTGTTPA